MSRWCKCVFDMMCHNVLMNYTHKHEPWAICVYNKDFTTTQLMQALSHFRLSLSLKSVFRMKAEWTLEAAWLHITQCKDAKWVQISLGWCKLRPRVKCKSLNMFKVLTKIKRWAKQNNMMFLVIFDISQRTSCQRTQTHSQCLFPN